MPAKIRLRRMGRKKQAHFRVVVADIAAPRDGRFVETLGYYKPLTHPARLVLNLERVDHWLGEGAQPSGTVKSLIAKARRGGDDRVALGEEDTQARKAKRAEDLAARRAAEQSAAQQEKEAEEAAAAAKAAEEAEAAAAEAAEAEAGEGEGGEAAAPAEATGDDAAAEGGDEPVASATEDAAAEGEGEPAAEAGADADAGDGEKSE